MNAVEYAEQVLGVNDLHDEATSVHESLEEALSVYVASSRSIRSLNERIDAREYELATEIRGEEPTISQTALERAIKDARHSDEALVELRAELRAAQDDHDQAHADVERIKYRLRVLSARLSELGGLLSFYAASKYASAQSTPGK